MESFKGYTLNAFQQQSVVAIREGKNVLVSAPTGAGKTLVAEYAIDLAIKKGRRCIYTSPIKALSNQKYRDFRDDPNINPGIMTGDVTINPEGKLLIMTTEILRNTLFEDPKRLHDVEYVIFDEIHFLDDAERGTVWEETIIFAPQEVRFIGLSATISNLHQFGEWISNVRSYPLEIVSSVDRPVPLKHYLYYPGLDPFPPREIYKMRTRIGRDRGIRGRIGSKGLLDWLLKKKLMPILFFCFSRKECEMKARGNWNRQLLDDKERERMDDLFQKICADFELKLEDDEVVRHLHQLALRGLGYHHAGMLPLHKELVERLFTSGMLKLLFTTETFAMGINMPARCVIFDSLRKFDGVSFDYLSTRDYMQMAGRAGRQGIDEEGLVYSILDRSSLFQAPTERILSGKVEPVRSKFNLSYSTLINLHERLGSKLFEAWEKSFNFFQASTQSKQQIEKNRRRQMSLIEKKLALLRELGYIDETSVLDRGRIASQINGYELQITEFLFSGLLDELDIHQINASFAAVIYEERKADYFDKPDPKILGVHKATVRDVIHRIIAMETEQGIPSAIRPPALETVGITHAWSTGVEFAELFSHTNLAPGDLVRTFRMTIQLLRQLRKALSPEYPLYDKLGEAIRAMNRDVVDARHQLELG